MRILVVLMTLLLLGCSTSKEITKQTIKFDKQYHENLMKSADVRMQYVSCDVGLIDGLGIANAAKFPIKSGEDARALLANPAISIALGEMVEAVKSFKDANGKYVYWSDEEYQKCYVVGLGYRVVALSTIDVLKLFPQLAPYLAVFQ